MATDAARHRLQGSGVLSCRIKINQPHQSPTRPVAGSGNTVQESPQQTGITPTTMNAHTINGMSSRRQDKLAEAIQSMANLNSNLEFDSPIDPDAQATVTDFLDFTEYLPADMKRSCTLIVDLDQTEAKASAGVHELTKLWGNPQDLPLEQKPDLILLRAQISETMGEAVRARTLSHTEAQRMSHNVDQHYNRAKNILAKLQVMQENYPPTRESSPVAPNSVSPVAKRGPTTLKLNVRGHGDENGRQKVRKHRAPRITVPGEVLAPYELDYESYGSDSDNSGTEVQEAITPRRTPAPRSSVGPSNPRIKLKIQKPAVSAILKMPKGQRPPGMVGTNAHSAVAGISTTNALSLLDPPPEDAKNGSEHKPWLQLTDWELGTLRKRMKKNAVWSPSDTMLARELKARGRGIEAYRAAKKEADASGQPLDTPVPPQLLGQTVHAEGAISVDAVRNDQEVPVVNRGMKLNEAKKLKKESQQKELAMAAEEAAEMVRKMNKSAEAMKNIYSTSEKPANTPNKTPARSNKRKRDSVAPSVAPPVDDKSATSNTLTVKSEKADRPPAKRTKTETPIPCPQPVAHTKSKPATPASTIDVPVNGRATSSVSDAVTDNTSNGALVPALTTSKSSTPILPPGRTLRNDVKQQEVKKDPVVKKESKIVPPVSTRPSRHSAVTKAPTPGPEPVPAKRPSSSRSKAASTEPPNFASVATATLDRPRRSSTARNTPTPLLPAEPRQINKRAKRPAPGVVTASSDGSSVSVGKRSSATRKKAGAKNQPKKEGLEGTAVQEVYDEYDDEGNLIDPDEPRYCVCNRVSFGTMIGCENAECEKEWFHLECVGLTDIPPRTTKWYCPDCRKKLGLGERGEVTARGKKK